MTEIKAECRMIKLGPTSAAAFAEAHVGAGKGNKRLLDALQRPATAKYACLGRA